MLTGCPASVGCCGAFVLIYARPILAEKPEGSNLDLRPWSGGKPNYGADARWLWLKLQVSYANHSTTFLLESPSLPILRGVMNSVGGRLAPDPSVVSDLDWLRVVPQSAPCGVPVGRALPVMPCLANHSGSATKLHGSRLRGLATLGWWFGQ